MEEVFDDFFVNMVLNLKKPKKLSKHNDDEKTNLTQMNLKGSVLCIYLTPTES